jgi:predicted DNA binding CopG/RHH family protein
MKYFELNKKEEKILEDFKKGVFESIKNLEEQKENYKKYTKSILEKNKNINIRLSERDLLKIKSKALKEGMPYQTLVSSVLHKFVNV